MAVKAFLTLILLFGSVAYIGVTGTLAIYALGNNEATKEKRIFAGIVAAGMALLLFKGAVYAIKYFF